MKKAEMSMTLIVSTIIILVVLVVLVIFFREKIGELISNITGFTDGLSETATDVDIEGLNGEII
ncbi:hypothetical protein J4426_00905 [Candidatus Woesearchaeota archaeon]|nr:hypothetical protein [Candidatus Woesearchaeota archaeon]